MVDDVFRSRGTRWRDTDCLGYWPRRHRAPRTEDDGCRRPGLREHGSGVRDRTAHLGRTSCGRGREQCTFSAHGFRRAQEAVGTDRDEDRGQGRFPGSAHRPPGGPRYGKRSWVQIPPPRLARGPVPRDRPSSCPGSDRRRARASVHAMRSPVRTPGVASNASSQANKLSTSTGRQRHLVTRRRIDLVQSRFRAWNHAISAAPVARARHEGAAALQRRQSARHPRPALRTPRPPARHRQVPTLVRSPLGCRGRPCPFRWLSQAGMFQWIGHGGRRHD
jgi:hypothetical protein